VAVSAAVVTVVLIAERITRRIPGALIAIVASIIVSRSAGLARPRRGHPRVRAARAAVAGTTAASVLTQAIAKLPDQHVRLIVTSAVEAYHVRSGGAR
jgi:MFS superfamily sulfate permease-like transporter